MHNHNVTISGGSDKLTFFGSGTYLYQDGLIPNDNYSRTNLRLNADAQILPWAKFSIETALRQGKSKSGFEYSQTDYQSVFIYVAHSFCCQRAGWKLGIWKEWNESYCAGI